VRVQLFGHYWHLPLVLLWLTESLLITATFVLACHLTQIPATTHTSAIQATVYGGCLMAAMVAMGMWSRRLRDRMTGSPLRLGLSLVIGGLISVVVLWPFSAVRMSLQHLGIALIGAWVALFALRVAVRDVMHDMAFKSRVLVYGAGTNAARILKLRRRADTRGFHITGFMPVPNEARIVPDGLIIPHASPLADFAEMQRIDEIVVAMDDRRQQFPLQDLLDCRLAGIGVTELVSFMERETGKVYLDILNPSWLIFSGGFRHDFLRRYSERAFDLLASLSLLIVTAPVMFATILAIKIEDGLHASVFYGQPRIGYAGRVFRVLKFRSMKEDAEADGKARWAETNDKRITRVGAFIRKARIDELPQLLNVLGGKMSFVGPRPERPEFVEQLAQNIPFYRERHSVKPGITGWAQLCYSYGASQQDAIEKLQYDLYYVKNHGLVFDILILLQTIEVILFGRGAR
jgi:sugar transferase (PEP-CTERM system associated)